MNNAMKLALKDLKWVDYWLCEKPMPDCVARLQKAIKALEEALAKQEQSAEHVGEPVGEAYLCDKCSTPFDGGWECPSCGHNSSTKEPVYTTPYVPTGRQQRTAAVGEDTRRAWVDLTYKEMDEAMKYWSDSSRSAHGGAYAAASEYVNMVSTWRYIEAKVKEKNNGS